MASGYDVNNVFARILRGELTCVKVWETEEIICIMDAFPEYPGHCLVIPKIQASTLFDLSPHMWGELMSAVYTTAQAVGSAFPECGVAIMQYNGAQAGQSVPHVHVHIVPRRLDRRAQPHGHTSVPIEALEENASRIRAALGF